MKLYNVPRNTKIRVLDDITVPPGAPEIKKGDELYFHYVDGMYSYCEIIKGKVDEQNIVHLVAWAEVEIV